MDYEVNGLASGRVRECSPERTNQPNASRSDAGEHRYAGRKRKGAPGGSGGGPPKKGGGAGGVPGQGSSGVGVAGPRREASGSLKKRLLPANHTRCAFGVPRRDTLAKIVPTRRLHIRLLWAGARRGEPTPCSWTRQCDMRFESRWCADNQ